MKHYIKLAAIPLVVFSQFSLAAEEIIKTITAPNNLHLKVIVKRGDVKLASWDKDSIQVTGSLDELSQGFTIKENGNSIELEDTLPLHYSGNNTQGSELMIMLPKSVKLYTEGVSANFQATALKGDINIRTVSGNIKASKLLNNVNINTVSGNIEAEELEGKLSLESISGGITDKYSIGSINYQLVSGDLNTETHATEVKIGIVSGDVKAKLYDITTLQGQSVSGDLKISLNTLASRINLNSVSGNIELTLPERLNANINLNGGPSGKINNELSEDKPKKDKYSPETRLSLQMGDGSADIYIGTISGEINTNQNK